MALAAAVTLVQFSWRTQIGILRASNTRRQAKTGVNPCAFLLFFVCSFL
jgi:hypothetical protein